MSPEDRAARVAGDDVVVAFPALLEGLPEVPSAALDPYLDAAARCFARYGISRTTVQDVAQEMGYNRATVYRQVGTIGQQLRLLAARELHQFLLELPGRIHGLAGPDLVVELAAYAVENAWVHPVIAKVLADDRGLATSVLTNDLVSLRDRVLPVVAPLLSAGMDEGAIARRDPEVVSSWLLRIVVSLVILPPEVALREYLAEIIVPVLAPGD